MRLPDTFTKEMSDIRSLLQTVPSLSATLWTLYFPPDDMAAKMLARPPSLPLGRLGCLVRMSECELGD